MDLNDAHSIRDVMIFNPITLLTLQRNRLWRELGLPNQTWDTDSNAVLHTRVNQKVFSTCRFYNAGSSEEFGDIDYSLN